MYDSLFKGPSLIIKIISVLSLILILFFMIKGKIKYFIEKTNAKKLIRKLPKTDSVPIKTISDLLYH